MCYNNQMKDITKEFIKLNGFTDLTNVQKKVFEFVNAKKDVIAISKTGTGKTHAYLIPIIENINVLSDKTQVLISLPTRELAYQVYQNAKKMCNVLPSLRIKLLSGGKEVKKQSFLSPHIIIGTPGKIKDLFVNNYIRVDFVQMFIIDEADMTLEYGFLEDIDKVFSHMVKNPQVLCFSATFPKDLEHFVKHYLNNPQIIKVEDKKRNPRIKHILIPCKHKEYKEKLLDLLPLINPYVCLIFANSKEEANDVYEYLVANNYKTLLIHGGLDNRQRQKAIKLLASKQYTYVVCSDVVSRGIDVDGVSHVISLGLPKDLDFYIHRSGRTGRNTKEGTTYCLYKDDDLVAIKSLEKKGVIFSSMDIKNNELKNIKSPTYKYEKRNDELKKAIAKTLVRKNEKVKPNYKKKKQMAIEEIKRKQRRDFIRSKIKEERIERYKEISKLKKIKTI